MELKTAINFIESAIDPSSKIWTDIGAGTGLFTQVLDELLLPTATIYAVDKNPHMLYNLALSPAREFHIVEGNFEKEMELPACDGIVMANALHYSSAPKRTIENIFQYLKVGGQLLIIEYETSVANPPWVPFPIPFKNLEKILSEFAFSPLKIIDRMPSRYGAEHIYAAICERT